MKYRVVTADKNLSCACKQKTWDNIYSCNYGRYLTFKKQSMGSPILSCSGTESTHLLNIFKIGTKIYVRDHLFF